LANDGKQDRTELVALRRLGTIEDCAKMVEFLATDLSDYVTSAMIPIDGGLAEGSGHYYTALHDPKTRRMI
jgi:NAD(P)-dependent dehydrogenase (short-subunit alcohol dehydrogenase family)